jgi:hypothetical protein
MFLENEFNFVPTASKHTFTIKRLIMQRSCFMASFTTISMLSAIVGIQFAQAATVRETTDFDQLRQPRVIGTIPSDLEGSVEGNDVSDIIRFKPSSDISTIKVSFSGANAAYTIVEDVNNSSRVDVGDRTLVQQTTKNPGKPIRVVSDKTYLAEVVKRNAGSSYRLSLHGARPQLQARLMQAKVVSMKALSNFDLVGDADFGVSISIDGSPLQAKKVNGNNSPTFNFGVRQEIPIDKEVVDIKIYSFESDPGSTINEPDISPDPNDRNLKLRYFPRTGEVFGPGNRRLGTAQEVITVQGDASKHKASITFTLNHSDVVF